MATISELAVAFERAQEELKKARATVVVAMAAATRAQAELTAAVSGRSVLVANATRATSPSVRRFTMEHVMAVCAEAGDDGITPIEAAERLGGAISYNAVTQFFCRGVRQGLLTRIARGRYVRTTEPVIRYGEVRS